MKEPRTTILEDLLNMKAMDFIALINELKIKRYSIQNPEATVRDAIVDRIKEWTRKEHAAKDKAGTGS